LAGERFEIFKDAFGKFRFRLRAQNGEIYRKVELMNQKMGAKKE
jgi:uncharacterized protein YegP (UPF0339 family)